MRGRGPQRRLRHDLCRAAAGTKIVFVPSVWSPRTATRSFANCSSSPRVRSSSRASITRRCGVSGCRQLFSMPHSGGIALPRPCLWWSLGLYFCGTSPRSATAPLGTYCRSPPCRSTVVLYSVIAVDGVVVSIQHGRLSWSSENHMATDTLQTDISERNPVFRGGAASEN